MLPGEAIPETGRPAHARIEAFALRLSAAVLVLLRRADALWARVRLQVSAPIATYEPGATRLGNALVRPALLGFVGSTAILLGASEQDSPFTSKVPGAWWFGIPAVHPAPHLGGPGPWLFLGVVAVYGGILLMLRAWFDLVRLCLRLRGIPIARLVPVLAAWVLPLLVVAPLFSKDAYSYAAQGELMTHHINPYLYGPGVLSNGTSFDLLTDGIWQNVTSPYGPLFLMLDGWIVAATHHNLLVSVEVLRFVALGGTALFAWGVAAIARSFGRDGALAFTLAVLNPLIVLHLVGGEHNDALMLGFLVVGYALARRGHPIYGIVCCAVAAAVKVPAFVGVVYIGWEWLGPNTTPRERLRPVATACLIAGAVMAVISEIAGIGWRWVDALSNPDDVRSWVDPATGLGTLAGHLLSLVGLHHAETLMITISRGGAFALAGVIAVMLLWRSDRVGPLQALGWSLVAVVALGPVVQPWYMAWGIVFLAPIAEGRVRSLIVGASAVGCFLELPGGFVLLNEITSANPALVAACSALLVGIAVALARPRLQRLRGREDSVELSGLAPAEANV